MNKATGLLAIAAIVCSCAAESVSSFSLLPDEKVWGGRIADGSSAPYCDGFRASLSTNGGNQVNSLLLTSEGRYFWSGRPFDFKIEGTELIISGAEADVEYVKAGDCLADAFKSAAAAHFPANGEAPPSEFFEMPQYNTWIELMYDQNQEGVLKYAEGILANGLPAGIIMIDDTWQDDYGKWTFAASRFSDPKAMVDKLHRMGFKVMLWVCPFVSMDQYLICRDIEAFDGFLRNGSGEPYPVRWWNGTSAVLDFSNPESVRWFDSQLRILTEEYGVDGFKFDAGDFEYYPEDAVAYGGKVSGSEQCSLFVQFASTYPYNELRAGWQNAGKPIVQRLHDKDHSWEDLRKLIPEMFAESLMGFSFCCPDMVGGGNFMAFLRGNIDQDLLVRSAQVHALMPMMQFSIAPWRVLDAEHYAAVLKAVKTRNELLDTIKQLTLKAASSGEPIVAPIEYYFPHQGYGDITTQFMLGPDILVAPMLTEGTSRMVVLPSGTWISDLGEVVSGGREVTLDVPIDRLPYFKKVENLRTFAKQKD